MQAITTFLCINNIIHTSTPSLSVCAYVFGSSSDKNIQNLRSKTKSHAYTHSLPGFENIKIKDYDSLLPIKQTHSYPRHISMEPKVQKKIFL